MTGYRSGAGNERNAVRDGQNARAEKLCHPLAVEAMLADLSRARMNDGDESWSISGGEVGAQMRDVGVVVGRAEK